MSASARSLRVQLIAFGVVAAVLAAAAIIAFVVDDGDGGGAGTARLDHPAQVSAFMGAAGPAVAVVTSYDYRNLTESLDNGLALTTGRFRSAYRAGFAGLRAGALNEHAVQTFSQLKIGAGQSSHDGTSGQVLVFGTEQRTSVAGTTSQDVTLRVTLEHHAGSYLISDLQEDANAGLPPGSAGLRAAAEAGRSEVVAVNSYRRKHFAADLRTALDGAIDPLRSQLRKGAPATKQALAKGDYDLSGAVTAVAVENVRPTEVNLLMAATGIKIAPDGGRTSQTSVRFEVTVDLVDGSWRTSQLTPVRGSG